MTKKRDNGKKKLSKIPINIKGEKVEVNIHQISIDDLYFDEFNPRISMYRDSHIGSLGIDNLNQDQIMFSLTNSPSYYDLKNSILDNNGALNPLWVYKIDKEKYSVIEGNTRLAVYKELLEEDTSNKHFQKMNCYVLDQKIDEDVKDFIRLTAHLHGQTPWDSYERAKYLFILWDKKRYPVKELVRRTKLTRREIMEDIEAYQVMEKDFKMVFPSTDRSFVHKFSYFKELAKNKKLKSIMDEQKLDNSDFSKWVADEKISKAQDVRKLPNILSNKATREFFLEKDYDRAYEKLKDIIPEKTDKMYQTMYELTKKIRKLTVNELRNIDGHKKDIIKDLGKELDDILKWGK